MNAPSLRQHLDPSLRVEPIEYCYDEAQARRSCSRPRCPRTRARSISGVLTWSLRHVLEAASRASESACIRSVGVEKPEPTDKGNRSSKGGRAA
jgi:hypothetical protein